MMGERMIRSVIGSSSLNLDPATITDVVNFMMTFVGDSPNIQIVKIYACTAIVCECKKIPSVNAEAMVSSGLTIEKIMNCVYDIPKDEFFSLLYLMASKWPRCPNTLFHKIDTLKTNYRIFKKYRIVCQAIGNEGGLADNINGLLSSFGWLIYLSAIIKEDQIGKLQIVPDILPLLFQQLYANYFHIANQQFITDIVSHSFPPSSLAQITRTNFIHRYRHRYSTIIKQVCQLRGYNQPIQQFIVRPEILQRLIDDLSSQYTRIRDLEYPQTIDEVSFLGLSKTLTPEVFRNIRYQQLNDPISNRLRFQGQVTNAPFMMNRLEENEDRDGKIVHETPLSTKLQCLAWIRSCIQSLTGAQIERAKMCYEKFRQEPYQQFLQSVNLKLHKSIETFTPTCRDFNHRKTQIFKFFTCCISTIIQMYSESDLKQIYESSDSIFSILSLCTEIFNFCYQARIGDYKDYCDIFEISLLCGFEPINWFGRFLNLPFGVSEHLFDVERRLLIKQIWQNQNGLDIIAHRGIELSEEYNKRIRICKRLQYHIKSRIRDICNEKMPTHHTDKMFKLIKILISEHPNFIANNNIDKVIVCSITAIICSHKNTQPGFKVIQQVVDQYRKIALSFETSLNTIDSHTQIKINIIQYYNQCFLPIFQSLISQGKNTQYFQTPKKIEVGECDCQGITELTGFASNARTESAFAKKSWDIRSGSKNFQRKLVNSIFLSTGHACSKQIKSESSEMIEQSEEDPRSDSS